MVTNYLHRRFPNKITAAIGQTRYGVAGDHGGAQRSVQRIPIAFYGAGVAAGSHPQASIRSVDIMPTVLRSMGIRESHPTDGKAYDIP